MSKITAHMAGRIIDLMVNEGDTVAEGQTVIVLESMKMEMPITASISGTVKEVNCVTGDAVSSGALLMVIE
ncbi:MAG: acetyl-CoA carboxylase biotin carboxyl carrier protein subunit [Pseudomonadota bacterium]